jgi:hypothetical protein
MIVKASGAAVIVSELAEGSGGTGDDLVVRYVPHLLPDVPAMTERIIKLAVPIAPEHFS